MATSTPWRRWPTAASNRICIRCGFGWTNKDVRSAITSFCQLAWNPAKHDYFNQGSPDPMIPFADAVASYFLARALGAKALRASNRLEPVVQAIRNERDRLEDRID